MGFVYLLSLLFLVVIAVFIKAMWLWTQRDPRWAEMRTEMEEESKIPGRVLLR